VPMSGDRSGRRYDIVADTRRRWSEEEKASIVAEAANCPNISALARRRGLKPSLLFRWRREQCDAKAATPVPLAFVPVALAAPAPSSPPTITPAKPNMIEIVIVGGRVVRAGTDIDTAALVRIIAALEGRS
jgi:transposase